MAEAAAAPSDTAAPAHHSVLELPKPVLDGRKKVLLMLEEEVLDYKHNGAPVVEDAVSTLATYFGNILEHPAEDKYRRVRAPRDRRGRGGSRRAGRPGPKASCAVCCLLLPAPSPAPAAPPPSSFPADQEQQQSLPGQGVPAAHAQRREPRREADGGGGLAADGGWHPRPAAAAAALALAARPERQTHEARPPLPAPPRRRR